MESGLCFAHSQVRGLQRVAGAFVQRTALRHLHYGPQQGELAGGGDCRVQWVEADAAVVDRVRVQADRGDAERPCDQVPLADAVLALRVQDHDLPVLESQL